MSSRKNSLKSTKSASGSPKSATGFKPTRAGSSIQRSHKLICKQYGFTLIEIALVLIIISLLVGAVVKAQALLTSARVHGLVLQQDGIKADYIGVRDRYRALPGDYNAAKTNIPNCSACENGDNNGQILTNDAILESLAAWDHLSKAGFIDRSYRYMAGDAASTTNSPVNAYGSLMQLIYDNTYQEGPVATPAAAPIRHNLKTGNNIPSDILAEVDRKVDDGQAATGQFRYSSFSSAAPVALCAVTSGAWNSTTPVANCGAASLF